MGHFMLTVLLLPFMKENGQICIVSSELHNYVSRKYNLFNLFCETLEDEKIIILAIS